MPLLTKLNSIFALVCLALMLSGVEDARAQKTSEPGISKTEQRAHDLLKLDAKAREAFAKEHPSVLPELLHKLPKTNVKAFSWVDHNGVGQAHEQKAADCWANAVTEAVECSWIICNGKRPYLSPQPLLDRTQNVDKKGFSLGNNIHNACDLLLKHGTAPLAAYPYTGKPDKFKSDVKMSHRIIAWGTAAPDGSVPTPKQLKEALLQHGPLAVSVYFTKTFQQFRGKGVIAEKLNLPDSEPKSNHIILLVGWDDRKGAGGAWRIRNSWGPSWGDDGYAWIEFGSNYVCNAAMWVKAQSLYYRIPGDGFLALVPDAEPLPRWRSPLDAAKDSK